MKRLIAALALSLAPLLTSMASAETKWTEVKRAESKIRLQLPGLGQSREKYMWTMDDQYLGTTHVAVQVAPNADFPRGQSVTIQVLSPDVSVQTRRELNAEGIRKMFGFEEGAVSAVSAPLPDRTGLQQIRRFVSQKSQCVAFEIFPSGVDHLRLGGGTGSAAVNGYYCGPPDVALSDNDIQWVLWGNEVQLPPGPGYVRLAAAPAVPASEALRPRGGAALPQATIEQFNKGIAAYKEKNYAAAMQAWRPLAGQGFAPAQLGVGFMLVNGEGVAKNPTEALGWLRKAGDQGETGAQIQVAQLYRSGTGTPRNYAEALAWYRKAAAQDSAIAHHEIALMYANGQGVAVDYAEAKRWLDLAIAKYGDNDKTGRERALKDRTVVAARLAEPKRK